MRIGVLGARDGWYVRDLTRAAKEGFSGELTVEQVSFSAIRARIWRGAEDVRSQDVVLNELDTVLVRSMPAGSLEQIIFRMDALHALARRGVRVVNSPRSLETAIDKYLSLSRMVSCGLPVPRTIVTQNADEALLAFHDLGEDVVVKPLFGSEGRGIVRVSDREIADRVFRSLAQLQSVLYLQEFIPHPGFDIRILAIGATLYGMRRHARAGWKTNISQGGHAEPLIVTDELAELARRAADSTDAELVAIDLLKGLDGRTVVLEANAVPGWRALSKCLNQDIARLVLKFLRDTLSGGADHP
jgi:ribosomal protein S6--L-glutamate ligase